VDSRSRERSRFPCRLALVGRPNPCPAAVRRPRSGPCRCGEALAAFTVRLSGPCSIDRPQVVMRRLEADDLLGSRQPKSNRPPGQPPRSAGQNRHGGAPGARPAADGWSATPALPPTAP